MRKWLHALCGKAEFKETRLPDGSREQQAPTVRAPSVVKR